MKLKNIAALAVAGALTLALAACGSTSSSSVAVSESASESAPESTSAQTTVLRIGASPAPHAEILEAAAALLLTQGIELEIVEFDDYVLPNTALEQGDLDANYFQHQPYLDFFNENNGTHIVSAASIHYEPLGIYPGKTADLASIADGAQVAIPNDGSNEARALYLLEAQGWITLDHSAGYDATPLDITENPYNLEFIELDADKLPAAVQDVDFAVINGNYAIAAGISNTVLVTEDAAGESAQTYANIVAVRAGDEARADIQALVDVLLGSDIVAFINERYQGSVVALGA